jgi:hypothetical protein
MEIALWFWRIQRSLTYKISLMLCNFIAQAKEFGEVAVFSHLFDHSEIDNPRSGAKGKLNNGEYRLLNSDWLTLESSDERLAKYNFEFLKSFGNPWVDSF